MSLCFERDVACERLAEITAQAVHDRRMDYYWLSEEYETIEQDLNEGLGCIRELVGDTAEATSALSCGTNDMDRNELRYLQDALQLVDSMLGKKSHDDYELVCFNVPSQS